MIFMIFLNMKKNTRAVLHGLTHTHTRTHAGTPTQKYNQPRFRARVHARTYAHPRLSPVAQRTHQPESAHAHACRRSAARRLPQPRSMKFTLSTPTLSGR